MNQICLTPVSFKMSPVPLENAVESMGNLDFHVRVVEGGMYRILKQPGGLQETTISDMVEPEVYTCEEPVTSVTVVDDALPNIDSTFAPLLISNALNIREKKRQPRRYTHFLSIPVRGNDFVTNISEFQHTLLHTEPERGLHKSMFQSPWKLHLTLCMLQLLTPEAILKCCYLLENIQHELRAITANKPLTVEFNGIDTWEAKKRGPQKTVIFTRPRQPSDALDILQNIYATITRHLLSAELITEEDQLNTGSAVAGESLPDQTGRALSPCWHLTLLNTKYSKRRLKTLDVKVVLEKHRDIKFPSCDLTELHLSCLQPTPTSSEVSGYYRAEKIVHFVHNELQVNQVITVGQKKSI